MAPLQIGIALEELNLPYEAHTINIRNGAPGLRHEQGLQSLVQRDWELEAVAQVSLGSRLHQKGPDW